MEDDEWGMADDGGEDDNLLHLSMYLLSLFYISSPPIYLVFILSLNPASSSADRAGSNMFLPALSAHCCYPE
jgi:hypothetical protein